MKPKEKLDQILRDEGKQLSDILDFNDAVDFLNTRKPTLYRWLADGKIKGFKAGKQWRFYRKDLIDFLKGETREMEIFRNDLKGVIEFFEKRLEA